jgi:hypothetical protein
MTIKQRSNDDQPMTKRLYNDADTMIKWRFNLSNDGRSIDVQVTF